MVKKDRGRVLEAVALGVMFLGLVLAVSFCSSRKAHAVEPDPSPPPTPSGFVDWAMNGNGVVLFIVVMVLIGVFALIYRNMIKRSR